MSDVFLSRRLPPEPIVLTAGPYCGDQDALRELERKGRRRINLRGQEGLLYRGRFVPVVAGGSLGGNLPARLPESSGPVYYVSTFGNDTNSDAAAQSASTPWATAQHAVTRLAALNNGGTARFAAGTYTGCNFAEAINSSVCTLEAMSGATVIFGGFGGSNVKPGVISISGASRWRLRNIHVDASTLDSGESGVWMQDGTQTTHLEFWGCEFHSSHHSQGSGDQPPGVGLFANAHTATDVQFWNCKFRNNGRKAKLVGSYTLSGSGQTITLDTTGDETVNPLPGAGNRPLQFWLPDRTRLTYTGISGSTITGCTGAGSWPSGTLLFPIGTVEPPTADHGSYLADTAGSGNPCNVLYANCLFYDNLAWGVQLYASGGAQIIWNVWIVNSLSAYNRNGAGFILAAGAADVLNGCKLINNIAYKNDPAGNYTSPRGGGFDYYFGGSNTTANQCLIDYAISNGNGGGAAGNQFCKDANTGGDPKIIVGTHTKTTDPLFRDPANRDFHLTALSPAIGFADPNYCPGLDYDGVTRG